MIDKHLGLIRKAASDGAQIVLFPAGDLQRSPIFCAEQSTRWYETTESVPDGPTVKLMQDLALGTAYRDGGSGLRDGAGSESSTTQPPCWNNDGTYLGNILQDAHSRMSHPVSGRSSISAPATSVYLSVFDLGFAKIWNLHLLRQAFSWRVRVLPRPQWRGNCF